MHYRISLHVSIPGCVNGVYQYRFRLAVLGPMWCVLYFGTPLARWYAFGTLPLHNCAKGDPPVRLVTFDVVDGIPPVYCMQQESEKRM